VAAVGDVLTEQIDRSATSMEQLIRGRFRAWTCPPQRELTIQIRGGEPLLVLNSSTAAGMVALMLDRPTSNRSNSEGDRLGVTASMASRRDPRDDAHPLRKPRLRAPRPYQE
jgi:hypothetical protein